MATDLRILRDVEEARRAAADKHGPLTRDPVRACAILGREWGEAMNEALLATRPPLGVVRVTEEWGAHGELIRVVHQDFGSEARVLARTRLYYELAQVVATAMLMMENLTDGKT